MLTVLIGAMVGLLGFVVTIGVLVVQQPTGTLRRMFALGRERTIEQDPAFALRVLVDVAIRALSPAVNDPTTAVQVTRRLRALLEALRDGVAPERRAVVEAELRKLDAAVAEQFGADGDLKLAAASDRQGLGGPTMRPGL